MIRFFCLCLLWVAVLPLRAQSRLQTPEQFLGYPLGEQFTTHDRVLWYVEHIAAQVQDQCKLVPYGTTYEGRPLVTIVVSSAANMGKLEEIRTNHLKSIGLQEGQFTGSQPIIAWMSYNVHGNESVSSEAVMQVLYDLVNPANTQTQTWLANTVVILDPCVNPDGRERYVQWYKQVGHLPYQVSRFSREHNEPWPGGRYNHYLFDLNRDWAWQTQRESAQRITLYNQWMPHLHADFHEMGVDNPYYFSPAAKPYHADITSWQRQFQHIIGETNRKYFDANGWLYFTREVYDLFYPSFGDTWPTFNGAIGMTYEQGGSGRAGLGIARESGDTLTLKQRIAHHHTASLATLEALAANQEQVVKEFRTYYSKARTSPTGKYKSYLIKTKGEESKAKALADYLTKQGIQFTYAANGGSVKGLRYATGKPGSAKVEENDLIIQSYQPKSTLLKVLFDPNPVLEDSLTYDITSWAIPYAYGLDAYALDTKLAAGSTTPKASPAQVAPVAAKPYAYLAPWKGIADVQFLAALARQKIKVRISEKAFQINGSSFQPGTLVITRSGNEGLGDAFDHIVTTQAAALGITLASANTGFVTSGSDFGSGSVHIVKAPKVAVMAGNGVSAESFGSVWHYFEQQIKYPVTVLETGYFGSVPLSEFEVLILPSGSYGSLLNDKALNALKEWVREGGKLIALEGAAAFLADKPEFDWRKKADVAKAGTVKSASDTLRAFGSRERFSIAEEIQGSVYRVSLDTTHPLAFGYDDTYFSLVRSATAYEFMKKSWNVGILKQNAWVSGYVGPKAEARLQDSVVFGVQEFGDGQIIYMADNPLFRAFWHGGKLIFANAVFMVGE